MVVELLVIVGGNSLFYYAIGGGFPANFQISILNETVLYVSAPEDTKLCDAAGDPGLSITHRVVPA